MLVSEQVGVAVARAQAARYNHVPGLTATAKMSCSVTQRDTTASPGHSPSRRILHSTVSL